MLNYSFFIMTSYASIFLLPGFDALTRAVARSQHSLKHFPQLLNVKFLANECMNLNILWVNSPIKLRFVLPELNEKRHFEDVHSN